MLWMSTRTPQPTRPTFSESFTVDTLEIDTDTNGTVVLSQTIRRDTNLRRTWMRANGSLVRGGMEQIMRCDFQPMGYLISASGQDANLSSWTCANQTIKSDPRDCQMGTFWPPLPQNATFRGVEQVDGRTANRWDYWRDGNEYALWASLDGASPVASGLVQTYHAGFHHWRILWRDFQPLPPPAASFDVTPGIECHPAPPPPPPFVPAVCKPACHASATCCKDPRAAPPGACFAVKNCSALPSAQVGALGTRGARSPPMPASEAWLTSQHDFLADDRAVRTK